MSTKKLWLYFLLYSEGSGNAATFLWSPVFASRFYRVGKFSCECVQLKHLLFTDELKARPHFSHCIVKAQQHLYFMQFRWLLKNPMKSHACSPFFARAKLSESANFECFQFYYTKVLITSRWTLSACISRSIEITFIRVFLVTHCHIFIQTKIFLML